MIRHNNNNVFYSPNTIRSVAKNHTLFEKTRMGVLTELPDWIGQNWSKTGQKRQRNPNTESVTLFVNVAVLMSALVGQTGHGFSSHDLRPEV
jgi:hypothetical protein